MQRHALTATMISLPLCLHAATLTGHITTADGHPVPAAFIEAHDQTRGITISVLSHSDGSYRIPNLQPAHYDVEGHAPGFSSPRHQATLFNGKQQRTMDLVLQPSTIRWTDLTLYQSEQLLPNIDGKATFQQNCYTCHGLQHEIANSSNTTDWRPELNHKRQDMHFWLSRLTDSSTTQIATYLNSTFSATSTLPQSPATLPFYQDVIRPLDRDATNIIYVEYNLDPANGMPWSATPDELGNVWIAFYGHGNALARLDPASGSVKTFPVTGSLIAGIHSLVPAPDGTVWFTEFNLNRIGHLDPATGHIDEYQDTPNATTPTNKHSVRLDSAGNLYATGSPFTIFDIHTHTFTDLPSLQKTYGLSSDSQGHLWFTAVLDSSIGTISEKTHTVQTWKLPGKSSPQHISVDKNGDVWFSANATGKITKFSPSNNTFTDYALPGPSPTPYALTIATDGNIWYASTDQDTVGFLNPLAGQITEYPFPHSEAFIRELFPDSAGRIWFTSPPNHTVGYFYIAAPAGTTHLANSSAHHLRNR